MDEDQDVTPPAVTTPEDKRSGDKETSAGKLVKLRAFNIFASRVRDSIKDENPVANGHEIKRIVGQKWAELGTGDKQEFIDVAQSENDLIERMPVDPTAPKRKRRRKPKPDIVLGDASAAVKKKGTVRGPEGAGANGESKHGEDQTRLKNIRRKDLSGKSLGPSHIAINAKGTVDDSVNAGYLMTVRVGDTDVIFRGVIFDPFNSKAPKKKGDLASGVKLSRKNDGPIFPSTGPSSSKQVHSLVSGALSSIK